MCKNDAWRSHMINNYNLKEQIRAIIKMVVEGIIKYKPWTTICSLVIDRNKQRKWMVELMLQQAAATAAARKQQTHDKDRETEKEN